MGREIVNVFDLVDGDPVTVEGDYLNTGIGAQFTQDGVTTTIPWAHVARVRRADRDELRRYAADDYDGDVPAAVQGMIDDVDYTPGDPDEDPEPPPAPGADTTVAAQPEQPAVRAGAGQEQVGKDQAEVDALKTDTVADEGRAREWPSDADNATMRAWAREQGLDVNESGPVSKSVATAYAAHNS
jgi:hypothetical protein